MLKVKELKKEVSINNIQERISEYNDGYICDIISKISDSDVDIYYSDLFEWAKDNWSYIDDACREFGMPDSKDSNIIIKLIQMGQYYKNE